MSLKYKPYKRKHADTITSYVAYIEGIDGATLKTHPWGQKLLHLVRTHGKYNPKLAEGKGWIIPLRQFPAFEQQYALFQKEYRQYKEDKLKKNTKK